MATGLLGFVTAILFLFCTPDLNTVFALDAPQPFVQIYALALGKGGSIFMTVIAVIGLVMVCQISMQFVPSIYDVLKFYRIPVLPLLLLPDLYLLWPVMASCRFRVGLGE
jgi:amino acid transporter